MVGPGNKDSLLEWSIWISFERRRENPQVLRQLVFSSSKYGSSMPQARSNMDEVQAWGTVLGILRRCSYEGKLGLADEWH